MDILERLRFARDRAQQAEETEKQRLADADTTELQSAASVRLATRQAVREALDDILDGPSDSDTGTGGTSDRQDSTAEETVGATSVGADEDAEASYAGAGTPDEGDVQSEPGRQSDG